MKDRIYVYIGRILLGVTRRNDMTVSLFDISYMQSRQYTCLPTQCETAIFNKQNRVNCSPNVIVCFGIDVIFWDEVVPKLDGTNWRSNEERQNNSGKEIARERIKEGGGKGWGVVLAK